MCNFVSWIEYEDHVYFIKETDLQTKEGRELLKMYDNNIYHEDIVGHGFIRAYYPELEGKGIDRENTDLSTPKNFPKEIVKQIINMNMKFGIDERLLNEKAICKYQIIVNVHLAQFNRICDIIWHEYRKISDYSECWPRGHVETAWSEYLRLTNEEIKKYCQKRHEIFWKLFENENNRSIEWNIKI